MKMHNCYSSRLLLRKNLFYMFFILVLLGSSIFSLPVSVKAEEIKNQRTIRVGYYIAPGFQEYDVKNNVYSGSSYEYLMAVKQYTNWKYEFIPVSFSDGVQMLQNGELDLMNNVSKTEEREKTLGFSLYASGSNFGCLIVNQNNTKYAYADYSSFQNMKIGIMSSSIFKKYFQELCVQHAISPTLIEFDSDDEITLAMENGIIDARIVSSSYQDGSRVVAKFAPMDYYFAVPKNRNDILQELNDAMVNIQTDMPSFEQEVSEKYEIRYSEKNVVLSEAENKYLQNNPIIKVAVSDDWYPISYFDKEGKYCGPIADIYEQIKDVTGLNFEFDEYANYDLALHAVASDQVDMIAEFPYDFIYAEQCDVQLSDFVNDIAMYEVINENTDDRNIHTVAVYGETYLEKQIKKMFGNDMEYIPYQNVDDAVNAVLEGEVDCTFVNYYCSTTFQNKGKYISLKYILIPALQYKFGLGISDNANPQLKSLIAKGLNTVDKEYIQSLFQMTAQRNTTPDMEAYIYQRPAVFIGILSGLIAAVILMVGTLFYSNRMKMKNIELERAKQAQSDFLSRMSHDMRTPMNGILGLSYLMENEADIDKVKEYIADLQESSNFLLQLINDVLDVNKIESGNLTLNPKLCDEEKLIHSILELMNPLIEEKKIHFHFEKINIEWQYIMMDEQRVKQIFINLLNNAVKFTPEGGKIDFIMELVSQTEDMIRNKFIIRDNGIGISEEFLPYIFEPFKQENAANVDYKNGTGLGLPIVKQLVLMMGGDVSVTSIKGIGTEFTVYINFPLAKSPIEETKESVENKAKPYVKKQLRSGIRILLCEDNDLNATIVTKLLEHQSAVVSWAKNGKEGLEMFLDATPGTYDIIFMDIRMPVMDGLVAAKEIRKSGREDAMKIPIIAISANAYEEDIEKSMDAGMYAHLAKPIEPNLLFETLETFVK